MCSRYFIGIESELQKIIEEMNGSPLAARMRDALGKPLNAAGEVRPTDIAPAVATSAHGSQAIFPMVFGFSPSHGGKAPLINARVETASIKPTFSEAWKGHRCAIPASSYFEWEHLVNSATGKVKNGDKHLIRPREAQLCWLAGLYRIEETADGLRYPAFVILTREPADHLRFIHDRMPVVLPDELVDEWIRPNADPAEIVRRAVTDMVYERVVGQQ